MDSAGLLKILKDKQGKILFVGTLRQIKQRLKKIVENGPLPFLLWQAEQIGYTVIEEGSSKTIINPDPAAMQHLKQKLKNVPRQPGIYRFLDKNREVIYIGKAKDLRARIAQYLGNQDNRPQLPYLMAEAADFDYTVAGSELESLFLENTLIKKHLPKYNIQLRDDKNYAFITIDYGAQIPQIGYARKIDKSSKSIKYFGPYSAAYKIKSTLNLVRRIFPYCAAREVGKRPCFYYYLHRCPGVCVGKVSLEDYRRQINKISGFLSGETKKVKQDLAKEMKRAARQKNFEQAARLRDQVRSLELLEERQIAILPKAVDWDVVSVFADQGYACVNLFKVRNGKLFDKENFIFDTEPGKVGGQDPRILPQVQQVFLEQYYMDASSAPHEIITEFAPLAAGPVAELIRERFSRKAKIRPAQRGKAKDLVKLARLNGEEYLKNWLASQAGHLDKINAALTRLKEILDLDKPPERIEGFDISNTQGTNAVGSMVVSVKGLPAKSEYRKFRIRTKKTPDDYAMMKEMLSRRIARMPNSGDRTPDTAAWPLPDLMVIDGGRGQLNAALEALNARPLPLNPKIIGLAKRIEEIFVPGKKDPIILDKDDPALQLLQRLRDEAHRFGITYHRNLRSRQAVKSALDDVPGIGPKTKKLLKEKFGTVADIRKASMDELSKVVGERIAQLIQQSL